MSDGTFLPSGATPWSAYNTPRIWAMVENEDDPESWRQVAALGSMAGLLNDQRKRLELARESLIQAWPPEQNVAAKAFVDLIDDLLFNMAKNKKIADSNAAALGQVLEALRQAKAKIEPLYRTYLEKNDDLVPGWWDNAEDELDEKAREQMRSAERIVAQPESVIVAPEIYELGPQNYVDDPIGRPVGTGSGSASGVTPFAAGGAGGGSAIIPVPHDPPPPLRDSVSTGPSERPPSATDLTPGSSGPSLAGVITPAPVGSPPIAAQPLPSSVVPGPTSPVTTPGLIIGGPGGPGGRSPVGGGQRGIPGTAVGGVAPGRSGVPGAKPATPSWLSPVPGQPAARGAAGQTGRGTSIPNSLMPGSPARGPRGRDGERSNSAAFDPDNPWVTDEGVAPVIEASRAQFRHDPGPGVIGWRQ
jgi:hypothetical protein